MVREGTTAQYNELKAEDERIDKKLKGMIRPSGRNTVNFFDGDNDGCMSSTVNIATGNGGYNTQGNVNQYRPTQNSENYGDRNGNQHELHRHQYGNVQDNENILTTVISLGWNLGMLIPLRGEVLISIMAE